MLRIIKWGFHWTTRERKMANEQYKNKCWYLGRTYTCMALEKYYSFVPLGHIVRFKTPLPTFNQNCHYDSTFHTINPMVINSLKINKMF
jgi:hypothetical protein